MQTGGVGGQGIHRMRTPLLHMSMGKASAHRTRTNQRARQHLLDWLAEYAPYGTPAIVHAGIQEEAKPCAS